MPYRLYATYVICHQNLDMRASFTLATQALRMCRRFFASGPTLLPWSPPKRLSGCSSVRMPLKPGRPDPSNTRATHSASVLRWNASSLHGRRKEDKGKVAWVARGRFQKMNSKNGTLNNIFIR